MIDPLRDVPPEVTLVEVGPRDGLQNEPATIGAADKIVLIDHLAAAGLPVIRVGRKIRARLGKPPASRVAIARR